MRKIKNLALTLLIAIMCVTSSLTSFAMYDDGSYDMIPEDDIVIVDNKVHPNATCQVLFHVLYPTNKIKEGQFQYIIDYYENGEAKSVIFQNRWENGNKLEETVGSGTVITYKIQLEPGEYSFTCNIPTEGGFQVLTPDLELPEYMTITAKTAEEYQAQIASAERYKTQVTGPMELFAFFGDNDFVEENKDAFIEYAKSVQTLGVDNSSDDILNDINVDDYNSLDELLNALREAGCTEEQIEMARATYADAYEGVNDEVVETEPTTVEEQHVETEGEESDISPLMPIIAIVLILVIICGIYVFIKKKDR